MKQYLDLLKDILENGEWNPPARENMPMTKSLHSLNMKFDLRKGFPAVTTKQLAFKQACAEICWIMRGETNIKWLWDNGVCHVWDDDAFRYYKNLANGLGVTRLTWEKYVRFEKTFTPYFGGKTMVFGDCGFIYGHQFRNFNGEFDQLRAVINSIKSDPHSRYHVISAWNPSDFFIEDEYANKKIALPACPFVWHFMVSGDGEHLDLQIYQRSCDMCLGVPFNIAEGAIMLTLIAKLTGKTPRFLAWAGGDCHIYANHIEGAKEQILREPYRPPVLIMSNREDIDIDNVTPEDFKLINYEHHKKIEFQLSTGL